MTKLIVRRPSEWNNRMRNFGIYLNGKKIGEIGNGETKEFEIEPGAHSLSSKIDWCGSEEKSIRINENDIKTIEISGFKFGGILMPIALIIGAIYFLFGDKLNLDPKFFLLIMLPFAGYLLFHLTLGRNKYLRLKEK